MTNEVRDRRRDISIAGVPVIVIRNMIHVWEGEETSQTEGTDMKIRNFWNNLILLRPHMNTFSNSGEEASVAISLNCQTFCLTVISFRQIGKHSNPK